MGGGGACNRKFMVPASNIFSDGCIYMCVNYDITSRLDYKFGCKSLAVVYRASKKNGGSLDNCTRETPDKTFGEYNFE